MTFPLAIRKCSRRPSGRRQRRSCAKSGSEPTSGFLLDCQVRQEAEHRIGDPVVAVEVVCADEQRSRRAADGTARRRPGRSSPRFRPRAAWRARHCTCLLTSSGRGRRPSHPRGPLRSSRTGRNRRARGRTHADKAAVEERDGARSARVSDCMNPHAEFLRTALSQASRYSSLNQVRLSRPDMGHHPYRGTRA